MNTIKDESGFKKVHDNGYIWSTTYSEQITKEQFEKNKNFLQKNVDTLKKQLETMESKEEFLKKKEVLLDLEHQGAVKALENYDEYFESELENFKKSKEKKKKELLELTENFEKAKKILLTQFEKQYINKIIPIENQLKNDEKQLSYYKQV